MDNYGLFTKTIALEIPGITGATMRYQLSPEELHNITIKKGQGAETATGALAITQVPLQEGRLKTDLL